MLTGPPPKFHGTRDNLHVIATYLYLLSLRSGGPLIPLDVNCQPKATSTSPGAQLAASTRNKDAK